MSTSIADIKGLKEHIFEANLKTETNLNLTRVYGGKENGVMLQLTIDNKDRYIQLTKKKVNELIISLSNCFANDI